MKKICLSFLSVFIVAFSFAQQEFHVSPKNHKTTPGTATGNGSLQNPWDLQTALTQSSKVVSGGDTIWLHEGVYNGRYNSTLNCTTANKYITVSAYPNHRVILNGNVSSIKKQVIEIKGNNLIFKNFEITSLNDFSRIETDKDFSRCDGVNHTSGGNCKFINLVIYNNPGSGFNSWKRTSNAEINECIIFNNGFFTKKRGGGVGMYVQNSSDKERQIFNNIVFNNYYKGIEVWSANKDAKEAYVKNVTLYSNVLFNNGLPAGFYRDNIIVASDDENEVNIAKNITISNNVLYHNTNLTKEIENTEAPSLTLGFDKKAPLENAIIKNNIIIGRKNALRVLYVKSMQFNNNVVYSGYVRINESTLEHIIDDNWNFNNNSYYTRRTKPIRIIGSRDYLLNEWKSKYKLDENSGSYNFKDFNLANVLDITKSQYKTNSFRVVLFNKEEQDVVVDFSEYHMEKGSSYTITDVENLNTVIKTGTLAEDAKITVPMQAENAIETKTLNNFGVFIIAFTNAKKAITTTANKEEEPKTESGLSRFFKWLF